MGCFVILENFIIEVLKLESLDILVSYCHLEILKWGPENEVIWSRSNNES